jgi:hypothetical protein
MFQVMQSVKVVNVNLADHGKAGHVVEPMDKAGKVGVKMDHDNEVYAFDPTDIEGL